MADRSLAQGRSQGEEGAVRFLVRLLGFVSGRRRLLQLRRRRFLSPRGRGYRSSVVGLFSLSLSFKVLVCLGGWRSRRRVIEARPRLTVLGRAKLLSRLVFTGMEGVCGGDGWFEWFPILPGESSVGLPGAVPKGVVV
ncbi:hypothetical protein IGI04_028514 [Brassica rapa subsp. trilocularis]|uniref:Uncharacterized protein n=1 Tax=Brassica rapa subsp. trilocularis TaxID=1813537 RepID=A0ABQ7L247_BRACM|nr:hypothetical protein IGI04_028514 [Brassica rapa subsp. trilocularis]